MLNRQYPITTIASATAQNERIIKIANYVTVGKKALAHLMASASLNALATVTETTSNNQETYIGLTENEFKTNSVYLSN